MRLHGAQSAVVLGAGVAEDGIVDDADAVRREDQGMAADGDEELRRVDRQVVPQGHVRTGDPDAGVIRADALAGSVRPNAVAVEDHVVLVFLHDRVLGLDVGIPVQQVVVIDHNEAARPADRDIVYGPEPHSTYCGRCRCDSAWKRMTCSPHWKS